MQYQYFISNKKYNIFWLIEILGSTEVAKYMLGQIKINQTFVWLNNVKLGTKGTSDMITEVEKPTSLLVIERISRHVH